MYLYTSLFQDRVLCILVYCWSAEDDLELLTILPPSPECMFLICVVWWSFVCLLVFICLLILTQFFYITLTVLELTLTQRSACLCLCLTNIPAFVTKWLSTELIKHWLAKDVCFQTHSIRTTSSHLWKSRVETLPCSLWPKLSYNFSISPRACGTWEKLDFIKFVTFVL